MVNANDNKADELRKAGEATEPVTYVKALETLEKRPDIETRESIAARSGFGAVQEKAPEGVVEAEKAADKAQAEANEARGDRPGAATTDGSASIVGSHGR